MNGLSEIIRRHRLEKGMTIEELAVKVRIGKGVMKAIEENRKSPDGQTLLKISTALDIPASEFKGFDHPHLEQPTKNGS
ncbi:helix-turn-helix domain-containing protein [Alkalihalobacillus sp. CinArs1]|uniref:helix-turn-helix domain-containing protein n=1 Tax=Alkalihalobacillus sp. CinArs1 TaxID=2995314 RepID=UPI0022DD9E5D|nr:helix-turn-helix transcriptional regulator [Alkalihalobacillus sp. CinArs1]